MRTARETATAGIVGGGILAACLLLPGLWIGGRWAWIGVLIIVAPTAALLTATGRRHYGFAGSLTVALVVTLIAGGVSWALAVFALVKALSGEGVQLVWAILPFVASAVSVLALGLIALRVVPARPEAGTG